MKPSTYCAAALLFAAAAQAAPLKIGVLGRADEERFERRRVELEYIGQTMGPIRDAVEVAIGESRFELEAAKLEPQLLEDQASNAETARAVARKLEQAGAAALIVDWPAAWIAAAAGSVKIPVLNAGDSADALRQDECKPNLLHTAPSERMRADAMAQMLAARRWTRVLVLHGPRPADIERLTAVQASVKRYGLRPVALRPFELSADPRKRDLANPLLLTGGSEYDVVWVVDTDGAFARSLPYRTVLPRPIVGDAGLFADAWAPHFERFGAPQLARRFRKQAEREMRGTDWAAWIATKAVLQAAMAQPAGGPLQWQQKLFAADLTLDGFKGVRLGFRPWDGQLRQPLLLTDGQGVIAFAPVEGILHPSNALDTLGADLPEKLCKR